MFGDGRAVVSVVPTSKTKCTVRKNANNAVKSARFEKRETVLS